MTINFPLLLNQALSRKQHSREDEITGAVLKGFLKRSQRGSQPLAIISVHGSTILDRKIACHAPQETEFIRIRQDLRNYLSKPRFDLILFSSSNQEYDESELYENLSYCRMLLKPGGSIWFLLEENHHTGFLQRGAWKKCMVAVWLSRTGFSRLHRRKIGPKAVFLCGSRPKRHF